MRDLYGSVLWFLWYNVFLDLHGIEPEHQIKIGQLPLTVERNSPETAGKSQIKKSTSLETYLSI